MTDVYTLDTDDNGNYIITDSKSLGDLLQQLDGHPGSRLVIIDTVIHALLVSTIERYGRDGAKQILQEVTSESSSVELVVTAEPRRLNLKEWRNEG